MNERPTPSEHGYILERSGAEHARLVLQEELMAPITRSLFVRAGIGEGMRVLDVGSGMGGVALLAAELVGPSGSVTSVEIDPDSVEAASDRAAALGASNVRFIAGDIAHADLPGPFDAVVGRLVLLHVPDPVAVLARARAYLIPGGVVAFLEFEMLPWMSNPPSPTLERIHRVREAAVGRVPTNLHMGLTLRPAFLAAGLPAPELTAEAMIGGGAGWAGFAYVEQTIRSLMPGWLRNGVEGADEIELDGLAERVEAEVGADGTLLLHLLVGAAARIPVA